MTGVQTCALPISEIKTEVAEIKTEVAEIKTKVVEIKTEIRLLEERLIVQVDDIRV